MSKNVKNKRLWLYGELLSEIRKGIYSEGDFFPTEDELSIKYDVSRSTINRTIQRLKEEGYVTRKAGFGTIISKVKNEKKTNIGLLVPGLSNSEIFEPICKTIVEHADEYDFNLYWNESNLKKPLPDIQKEIDRICDNYIENGVAGVFLSPLSRIPNMYEKNEHIVKRLIEAKIHIVLIDRDIVKWPDRSNFDLVCTDNIHAGYAVGKYLLSKKSKKLIFLIPEYTAQPGMLRYIGAERAVEECRDSSLSIDIVRIPYGYEGDLISLFYDEFMPDSVICSNDTVAAKVFQSCLKNNIKIPDDFQMVGFDNVNFAQNLGVALTSYSQSYREISIHAMELMKSRISGKSKCPKSIIIQGSLCVRNSTLE